MSKGWRLALVDVDSIIDVGIDKSELTDISPCAGHELVPTMEMCSAVNDS